MTPETLYRRATRLRRAIRPRGKTLWSPPTAAQELLLRACLRRGDEAVAAWRAWKFRVGFANADLDAQRLFPLLARNLRAAGVEDEITPRLEGVARRAWCANRILFRDTGEFLRACERAGIEVMLLRGAALATVYYQEPALRSMRDVDLLVGRADLEAARRLHRELRAGPEVALGERVLHGRDDSGLGDAIRGTALRAQFDGVPVRAPGASEMLFLVCAGAASENSLPDARWVADAVMVSRTAEGHGGGPHWERIVELAKAAGAAAGVARSLTWLDQEDFISMPPIVSRELADLATSTPRR